MTLIFLLGLLGAVILTLLVTPIERSNSTSLPEYAMIPVRVAETEQYFRSQS
jgi:hypothetical protein